MTGFLFSVNVLVWGFSWIAIAVLLSAALIGTLWVPFYNYLTPKLGGFPFFYWYQAVWILLGAALTTVVYFVTREET